MSDRRLHLPATLADLDALRSWVSAAQLGRTAEWHRGDLALDRRRDPQVDRLARQVAQLKRAGLVRAFAIEVAPGRFVHRVVRSRERLPRRSTSPLPGKVR